MIMHNPNEILTILDACCNTGTFPMLDNGYVYLAASRLSLHRSISDWALVIEIFGFSPRAGTPDLHIYTFASQLYNRNPPDQYISRDAHARYLAHNPHNESRFFFPIDGEIPQDDENCEVIAEDVAELKLRGQPIVLPSGDTYLRYGIELEAPPHIQIFEVCRFLAATQRELVLATPEERRVSVRPEMQEILLLDAWRHPDLLEDELPSTVRTFQQLSRVLATGDITEYRADEIPNTHWSNWPEGGLL